MKRFIYTALAALICISLVSCSVQKEADATATVIVAEQEGTAASETIKAESSTEKTSEKNSQAKDKIISDIGSTTSETSEAKSTAKKKSTKATTVKASKAKKTTGKSKPSANKTESTAKKPAKTTATTTTSASVSCTVTVSCSEILNNMNDLKAGHESFVPSNGMIINRTTVTVKNGSTAYDVLKKACDSQGVPLNATSSGYGKYIAGINNIDEKDCGDQSGWTYTVNGSPIWKSCDKYVVKSGDSIEFNYVCKY